ncbi:MAG: hypothetical protein J7452_07370 [Thermoflexus sp.]|jgi:hypothetical protein|nr:hypothetical protein [Thermoflexus sp.]
MRTGQGRWILLAGVLLGALSACAPASPGVSPLEGFSPLPAPAGPTPPPGAPGGSIVEPELEAMPEVLVEEARQDLASRLNLDPGEIRVVETRGVTWPDSSLGCPEPGRMYLQVLTPGYRIVLEAQGQRYAYHAGRGGPVLLCPPGRAQEPLESE